MNNYKRKISGEEAQGQYILVLKNALDFFPKAGKNFKLNIKSEDEPDTKSFEVAVNPVSCWCMGPNKPHNHYRIDAKIFREVFPIHFGKKIEILKENENEYLLR